MQASKPPLRQGQAGPRQAEEAARQAQREDTRLAAAQAQVIADIQRLEAELRALHARAALLAEERRALTAPPQVRYCSGLVLSIFLCGSSSAQVSESCEIHVLCA